MKPEILQNIWDLAEENLTTGEINNKMLFATDRMGKTVLHLATLNSEIEVLQKLRVWAKEKVTAGDVSKKLLFARYHNGRTVWKCTTGVRRPIFLEKLLEWAKEKITAGVKTKEFFYSQILKQQLGKDKQTKNCLLYLFVCRNTPQWVGTTSYLRLHDHTQSVWLLWTIDHPCP